jgi:hypothetical protein
MKRFLILCSLVPFLVTGEVPALGNEDPFCEADVFACLQYVENEANACVQQCLPSDFDCQFGCVEGVSSANVACVQEYQACLNS